MSTIGGKLDTIMNRMNNQERKGNSSNEVGVVEAGGKNVLLMRELLMKVLIKLRELILLMGIETTTSSQTTTFQPTIP